jgi:hypothetical protein
VAMTTSMQRLSEEKVIRFPHSLLSDFNPRAEPV